MATTISVNGTHGATLAGSTGIHLVQNDASALVLYDRNPVVGHGQPGTNAPRTVPGGPAGTVAVQLSESQLSQGAIRVQVIDSSQARQLPPSTEVSIGRDLLLTAIGGIGESGHNGGDGQAGMDGVDGVGATRGSDATNGTDGGNGGAAGQGTSGANGGAGGNIHIVVDEDSTHLLMAASCDVRGGIGGRSGKHGKPGRGGTRGKAGQGWRWEQIVGYRYFCTSSCITQNPNVRASKTTDLVRVGSRIHASSQAMTAPIGAMLVSGNNLQRAIVQARRAYNAVERPRVDHGVCKCDGGNGTCTGCDMKPIIKNFKRAPGLDGKDGETGASVTTILQKGSTGEEGLVSIDVQHRDGSVQRYSSSWSLKLVDFEMEDENGDGIFEPGEFLHIRRVRVRNVGGMPSPTCPIAVSLADCSNIFEQIPASNGGVAFLPISVPSTGEATMEGSIRVRIKHNTRVSSLGKRFGEKGWLQIRADVPWLDRRLPSSSFELRKEVHIAYPCDFGTFQHLDTVSQGSTSMIQYEICNFGNRPIGNDTSPGRASRVVEVTMTIPQQYGRLSSDAAEGSNAIDELVPRIRPRDATTLHQQFSVLGTAKNHGTFRVTFDLYLEDPGQPQGERAEMVLVERRAVNLQVSSAYTPKPNAQFLLVSNSNTTERQSRAIQEFIQNTLLMEVDLCNIHQNAGLLQPSESASEEEIQILSNYHGKTVVFLDDAFEFLGAGNRMSNQLCDPMWLRTLATNRSSALFIGTSTRRQFEAGIRRTVHPIDIKTRDVLQHVRQAHHFSSLEEMLDSILQERKLGLLNMSIATVALKAKWHHSKSKQNEKAAKAVAAYLHERLPNERFVVSHDSEGHVVVFTGLSHDHHLRSIESGIVLRPASNTNPTLSRLDRYSKYMIIAAMPFRQRIELLWENVYTNESVVEAIRLSVIWDLIKQISGLQQSKYRNLLRTRKEDTQALDVIIKAHTPYLSQLVSHPRATASAAPPEALVSILVYILGYATTVRRHSSLKDLVVSLLSAHTSTAPLLRSEDFRSAVNACNPHPEALLGLISNLTHTPQYVLSKGQTSASDVVSVIEYWAPSRWDVYVQELETDRERLRDDMETAKKELGRMVVEPLGRGDSAAELSG